MMRTSTRVYYKKDPDILKTDVRFEDKWTTHYPKG
jgi:hypothetical protein